MALTVDCGEGKHDVCSGSGTDMYLFPQLSGERFSCDCHCHADALAMDCPNCDGTGAQRPSIDPCWRCNGEGVIASSGEGE